MNKDELIAKELAAKLNLPPIDLTNPDNIKDRAIKLQRLQRLVEHYKAI